MALLLGAKLYALKISQGTSGSASSADMVDAWEWAITHQNDDPDNPILIVNTSFGGGRYFSTCDGTNSAMTQAALNGVNAGITHFVSSGNDGYCDSMGWPACISHVNSIGAVYDANVGTPGWCLSTSSCLTTSFNAGCSIGTEAYFEPSTAADRVTAYSNTDTNLTFFAPSNNAYSPDIAGTSGYSTGNYTTSFGGTSAAAPYSSGAAAVLQSAAKIITGNFLTPAQVRSTFETTGDTVTDPKVSVSKPRINLGAAVASLAAASAPDLTVISPSASSNSLEPLNTFIFFATVMNQGNDAAASATLTYYRSNDSTITTSDTNVGNDAIPSLAAAASSPQTISLTAPATAGIYYYGACVTEVSGESSTSNNCSTAVAITVTTPPVPDAYEEDDSSAQAKSINLGETQSRSIHDIGDNDWVEFTLTEQTAVTIETNGLSGDTELWLYDSSDDVNHIGYNDDGGVGLFSSIDADLAPGSYFIRVRAFYDFYTIADYQLSLTGANDDDFILELIPAIIGGLKNKQK